MLTLAAEPIPAHDQGQPPLFRHDNAYLSLALVAIPLSMFLVSVALGQTYIIGFYGWICLACLIAGAPLIFGAYQSLDVAQKLSLTSVIAGAPPKSLGVGKLYQPVPIKRELNKQFWCWRDWQICYTYQPNPVSQVPVILLHGFGGSIGHWRHNIPALSRHHDVYALDLLGFGASAKPATHYSIQLWAEQVYEFWQAFVQVPAVFVGNSIGSLTCLAIAANHPQITRGIAMVSLPDTSGYDAQVPLPLRPLIQQLQAFLTSPLLLYPLFYLLRQPWVVKGWAKLAYARPEAITEELLEILTTPTRDQDAAQAFTIILRAMLNPRFSPQVQPLLRSLQIPSLLVWGQQDRMIPLELGRRFAACNPSLKLVELANAGHCAHDECPQQVNDELLSWIEGQIL